MITAAKLSRVRSRYGGRNGDNVGI
jgi:hypothetical protein